MASHRKVNYDEVYNCFISGPNLTMKQIGKIFNITDVTASRAISAKLKELKKPH